MKYLKFDFQVSLRSFSSCFDFEIPLFENKNLHKQKSVDLRFFFLDPLVFGLAPLVEVAELSD